MANTILDLAKPDNGQGPNPMTTTSGTGQALSQTQGLPNLSTSSTGMGVGNNPAPTAPSSPYSQVLKSPANTPAPAATPPSPSSFPQDSGGQQQLQNATQNYNQANPQTPAPVPPSKVGNTAQPAPATNQGYTPQSALPSATQTKQSADTSDAGYTQEVAQTQATAQTFQNQSESLENANVLAQGNLQDETVQQAQQTYQAEQANLNSFSQKAADSVTALNAAAESTDITSRADAQDQYNNDMIALKYQQAQTDDSFNTQIAQQQAQSHQAVIGEESRIAALGGYGNLTSYREMAFTVQQNDIALNQLVLGKSNADQATTAQILQTNKSYNDNLNTIEATKQTTMANTYQNYLQYVQQVTEDKNKSEDDKYTAITGAAKDYTTNVAQIHGDALTARHDASTAMGTEVDRLRQQQITNQRANLQLNTFTDNNGNVTLVGTDTRTGKVISNSTLNSIGASLPKQLQYNPYTAETNVFDPNTGQVVVPGSDPTAGNYFNQSVPTGYNAVGDSLVSTADLKSIFNIGGIGIKGDNSAMNGQCGHEYNQLTTGPKVGDTWQSKLDATSIRPTVADGRNVDIKPGMGIALPLMVKTDGTGTGHMETVLSYDPKTGIIQTISANLDGKGTVQPQTLNIDQLESMYANKDGTANFGFTDSTFKPAIQSQLDKASMPYGAPNTPQAQGGQPDTSGIASTVMPYLSQLYNGTTTMAQVPSNMQVAVKNAMNIVHPDWNQTVSDANAAATTTNITAPSATHAALLQSASQNLIQLQASEQAADDSLDQLSQMHSKLPSGGQVTFLNQAEQLLGSKVSNDASAAFNSAYTDALQQAGIVITNGNAVTANTGAEIQGGLPADLDQKAFEAAIAAVKNTMSNKVKAANDQVLQLQNNQNIATPDSSSNGNSANQNTPAPISSLIQQAQTAGYSSQDIVNKLTSDPTYGSKVQQAIAKGISPDTILEYLNTNS